MGFSSGGIDSEGIGRFRNWPNGGSAHDASDRPGDARHEFPRNDEFETVSSNRPAAPDVRSSRSLRLFPANARVAMRSLSVQDCCHPGRNRTCETASPAPDDRELRAQNNSNRDHTIRHTWTSHQQRWRQAAAWLNQSIQFLQITCGTRPM